LDAELKGEPMMINRRHLFCSAAAGLGRVFPAAAVMAPYAAYASPSGVSSKEILIGNSSKLSGPLSDVVKAYLGGAQLAFAATNGKGGVAGRMIRMQSLDDELQAEKAVANYKRLLDEGVFCFFGGAGTPTLLAAAPTLRESGAVMIGGYSVADSAREAARGSAYFVRATTQREVEAIVQHLTTIGISRIGAGLLDNAGGVIVRKQLDEVLSKHRLKLEVVATVKTDGSDIQAAASTLVSAKPQVVIMLLPGVLPGQLMNECYDTGGRMRFFGMSIVSGEAVAKVLGERVRGNLTIAQVVPYPWNETDAFVKTYRKLAADGSLAPSYLGMEGYIAGTVLVEALRRCGTDFTRSRLSAAMKSLQLRFAGMNIDYSGDALNGSRYIDLVSVKSDGTFLR
jgi:branched-chain amino acid transport system substrate-binding protein